MKQHMLKYLLLNCLFVSVVCLFGIQRSDAQQPKESADQDWYYSSESKAKPSKSIAQQKAETKAKQRIARLETYRWLGYSPNRPPATVIPFTSSNGLQWKKAERNQVNWHTGYRPRTSAYWPYYLYYQ